MSKAREIIAGSSDLKQLSEEGFELSIRESHLLVSSVPYVTATRSVARGILIFPLTMASDITVGKPKDHTAYFAGDVPHYADGQPIAGIINNRETKRLAEGVVAKLYFSSKPQVDDSDFHIKVRRYVEILSGPARELEPNATAQTRIFVESQDDDSPFVYLDTNSARAGITPITAKLKNQKIAIVGVGGTGSYIVDLLAKTPVREIHLYDDDEFSLHNAYRSPGAPTKDQLRARMLKTEYVGELHRRLHKGVISHPERVTAENVEKLRTMDYVFLCMDPGPEKARIVEFLVSAKIPFSDTGLGVKATDERLVGVVNTITVTPDYNRHVGNVPVKAGGDDELYLSNIQIAELNMLNAVMAVIRWKKYCGFYTNDRNEHESTYTIGPNMLTNEETQA